MPSKNTVIRTNKTEQKYKTLSIDGMPTFSRYMDLINGYYKEYRARIDLWHATKSRQNKRKISEARKVLKQTYEELGAFMFNSRYRTVSIKEGRDFTDALVHGSEDSSDLGTVELDTANSGLEDAIGDRDPTDRPEIILRNMDIDSKNIRIKVEPSGEDEDLDDDEREALK